MWTSDCYLTWYGQVLLVQLLMAKRTNSHKSKTPSQKLLNSIVLDLTIKILFWHLLLIILLAHICFFIQLPSVIISFFGIALPASRNFAKNLMVYSHQVNVLSIYENISSIAINEKYRLKAIFYITRQQLIN